MKQFRYTLKTSQSVILLISRGVQYGCVCNLLLFRQVGHLQSTRLLIFFNVQLGLCKFNKLNVCFLLKHNLGDCIVHLDGFIVFQQEPEAGEDIYPKVVTIGDLRGPPWEKYEGMLRFTEKFSHGGPLKQTSQSDIISNDNIIRSHRTVGIGQHAILYSLCTYTLGKECYNEAELSWYIELLAFSTTNWCRMTSFCSLICSSLSWLDLAWSKFSVNLTLQVAWQLFRESVANLLVSNLSCLFYRKECIYMSNKNTLPYCVEIEFIP